MSRCARDLSEPPRCATSTTTRRNGSCCSSTWTSSPTSTCSSRMLLSARPTSGLVLAVSEQALADCKSQRQSKRVVKALRERRGASPRVESRGEGAVPQQRAAFQAAAAAAGGRLDKRINNKFAHEQLQHKNIVLSFADTRRHRIMMARLFLSHDHYDESQHLSDANNKFDRQATRVRVLVLVVLLPEFGGSKKRLVPSL